MLTSEAGHGFSPLDFCAEKSHNKFGSGLWFTPRFGLAPQPVKAGSGALIVSYVLGWWFDRDFHGVTGSECNLDSDNHAAFILPESPVDAGLSLFTPKLSLARKLVGSKFLWLRLTFCDRSAQSRRYSFTSPLVSGDSAPARLRLKDFLNLSRLFHSSDRCVDGGKEIGLGWQSQRLNPVANFDWKQRSIEGSEYNATGIGYSVHQSGHRRGFLVRFGQFVQGSNLPLLSRNFVFKLLAVGKQLLQFAGSLSKISFVIVGHRSI